LVMSVVTIFIQLCSTSLLARSKKAFIQSGGKSLSFYSFSCFQYLNFSFFFFSFLFVCCVRLSFLRRKVYRPTFASIFRARPARRTETPRVSGRSGWVCLDNPSAISPPEQFNIFSPASEGICCGTFASYVSTCPYVHCSHGHLDLVCTSFRASTALDEKQHVGQPCTFLRYRPGCFFDILRFRFTSRLRHCISPSAGLRLFTSSFDGVGESD